ncbi:MAG: MFS transporter [Anaerolineae bacterium]|jgi:MFS family permease
MIRVRRIARREDLLALFAMVFLADVAIGIQRATFSLFASSLGATLTMIGFMGGTEGLTGLLLSVPVGSLSDRVNRRIVVGGGLLLFAASYLLCALTSNPYLLYPARILTGVGVASTFYLGLALVSDIADEPDRGLSIGLYTTCMGIGFAVGSGVGGRIAEDLGFSAAFQVATVVVLASFVILRWGPVRSASQPQELATSQAQSLSTRLAILRREPVLLAACIGNLGIAMANEGATFNFFPLYAASLAISTAAIGSIFSARMLSSSAVRLPTGALADLISSRYLMVGALALSILVMFAIPFTSSSALLTLIMIGDGIAFGMYFTAGNAAIAEHSTTANRGIATGLFIMAGSIGTTLGPIGLGAAAERWGLQSVFWLTGAVLLVGLLVILYLQWQARPKALPSATGRQAGVGVRAPKEPETSSQTGHEPGAGADVIE